MPFFWQMRQRKRTSKTSRSGFSEDTASYAPGPKADAPLRQSVELGAGGRLVIPAPMRSALGMQVGDRLIVRLEGNQLRIFTFDEGLRQAREVFAKYVPAEADPVDDFLKWKGEQAALEAAKHDRRDTDD